MQFIKILLWVLLLVGCFIFWWSNQTRSSLDVGVAIIEARVSTFALGAFLAGFVPTWLLWRTSSWRLKRRIKTLEDAARPNYTAPAPAPAPLDLSKEQISPSTAKPAVSSENIGKAGA